MFGEQWLFRKSLQMQQLWPKMFSLKLLPEQGGNAGGFQSSEQDLCVPEQGEDILPIHWLNFTFKSLSKSRNKPQDVPANPHLCTRWLCFQKELILAIIPFFSCCPLKVYIFQLRPFTSQPILLWLQEINFWILLTCNIWCYFLIPWTWPSCSLSSLGLSRSGIQWTFQGTATF